MARRVVPSIVTYSAVTLLWLGMGLTALVVGVPARYGVSTNEALAIVGGGEGAWAFAWTVCSLLVFTTAVVRARHLALRAPEVRFTAVRGALWLWGVIGLLWFSPWAAWDVHLDRALTPDTEPPHVVVPLLSVALWSCAVSPLCLLVAALWSSWLTAARKRIPLSVSSSTYFA